MLFLFEQNPKLKLEAENQTINILINFNLDIIFTCFFFFVIIFSSNIFIAHRLRFKQKYDNREWFVAIYKQLIGFYVIKTAHTFLFLLISILLQEKLKLHD